MANNFESCKFHLFENLQRPGSIDYSQYKLLDSCET